MWLGSIDGGVVMENRWGCGHEVLLGVWFRGVSQRESAFLSAN